jgi:hypothetical protein
MEVPEVVNPKIGHIRKAVVGNQRTVDTIEQTPAESSIPDGVVFSSIWLAIDRHG